MSKTLRRIVVVCALLAFGVATVAVAADFYVVKDAAGKVSVVDKKPADEKSVVKGPFKTKDDAEKALKAAGAKKKPAVPPAEGC
jgi:hypothetical protein